MEKQENNNKPLAKAVSVLTNEQMVLLTDFVGNVRRNFEKTNNDRYPEQPDWDRRLIDRLGVHICCAMIEQHGVLDALVSVNINRIHASGHNIGENTENTNS